ncbi:MAG: SRPBCC domain-containing protein [Actinomycetota bacterium]|nr:SRPBCC domain-containing protein [Actinomycetota bacterium]
MTVVSTAQDPQSLTFTIVADLAARPSRVWQLWSDPRQLERWWGPPTWPATFETHEHSPGGRSRYFMTGPAGEKARGWWLTEVLDEPRRLEFDDGFSDESGEPDTAMPTIKVLVELAETDSGTRMTVTSRFGSVAEMERVVQMGMVEGMTAAMGQMDALLTH